MSATDFLPRCKYKKNLANDVHCELYFLQKYAFLLNLVTPYHFFLHYRDIICSLYTFLRAKIRNNDEKWKKQCDHFFDERQADYFHFAIIIEYHSFDNNRLGGKVGIYHYLHSLVVWFTDVITPMEL